MLREEESGWRFSHGAWAVSNDLSVPPREVHGASTAVAPVHPSVGHGGDANTVRWRHYEALADAVDRAQFGVIITPRELRPTFVNAYAQRVLDRRDGLVVTDTGLEALIPADTRALRQLVDRSSRRQLETSATLLLRRAQSTRPLAVYVSVRGYSGAVADQATVFVCDPDYHPHIANAELSRLYGLTRAEASLAILLVNGNTLEEIAATLHISIHTARTHLKRILLKTDTSRQAELLRLILSCTGHVRLD